MAMASGKRGKDVGRNPGPNTGRDVAREAIETNLLSFSKEVYRTLDAKQAEIQRLAEMLEKAQDELRESATGKTNLEITSNRLTHALESLVKAEHQLKVVNESLKEANEARKSIDEARSTAEDSRKDALSQRDWFKAELDRIRVESEVKFSESQRMLEEAVAELNAMRVEFKSLKAECKETRVEIEEIRREKDAARSERDQAVKMLHQAQLETEEWKGGFEKREGDTAHLCTQLAYWKDQAKNWHDLVADSTRRDRNKFKSESAAVAAAPLTPASASGSGSRSTGNRRRDISVKEDEEDENDAGQEQDTSTPPESPVHVQRMLELDTIAPSNAGAQSQRARAFKSKREFKTLPKTPQTAKSSTSTLTRTKIVPSNNSKPPPSPYVISLSSSRVRRRDDVIPESNRGRPNSQLLEEEGNQEMHDEVEDDGHRHRQGYESEKILSSVVYPTNSHALAHPPITPRTYHDQASHYDRFTHPRNASSSNTKAKATPRSVTQSRVVRRVSELQFVVKEEDNEPGVVSGSASGHHALVNVGSGRETYENVYDGELEDDELDEESSNDGQPAYNLDHGRSWEKGKGKAKAGTNEVRAKNRSQSAWDLFDDDKVEDGIGEEGPVASSSAVIGSSSKGRGRGTERKAGRVKSRGRGGAGSSRSRSRPKPKAKHVNEDEAYDEDNPDSEYDDHDNDKVEYHRPPQPTRQRPKHPSNSYSSSPASSEDELMITSQGVGGIEDSPSLKKRPPSPSSTSDGGIGGTVARKKRKR